jgi:hypothetical protein
MSTSFANDRDVGSLGNSQHLSSAIDFYTLNTLCQLATDDFSADNSGRNLIRVGEIIGIQAQPVMTNLMSVGPVDLTVSANQTLYGLGSNIDGSSNSTLTAATIYVLKFSIEHTNAWINTDVTGTLAGTLAYALVTETAMVPFTSGPFDSILLAGVTANSHLAVSAILAAGGNAVT